MQSQTEITDGYVVGRDRQGNPTIRCKRCHTTSHNVNDVRTLYCALCRKFHVEKSNVQKSAGDTLKEV